MSTGTPGRPRKEVTQHQRDAILRLGALRRGRRRIMRAVPGVTQWQVRRVLEGAGMLPRRLRQWTEAENKHLREHAGERGPKRLTRDLRAMGFHRDESAVRRQLSVLALSLPTLRVELTLRTCEQLIGRSVPTLMAHIRRRELSARMTDGAWRVWPSELREYVLADKGRVDWARSELPHELMGLLASEWGVSEDGERRKARKARREAVGA